MIDSQLLRIFSTLARHLNMSRAARELGITTSGVSHALKKLEQDLDCQLFERNLHKLSLTRAGIQFAPEADAILRQMREARKGLESMSESDRGQLRVGVTATACHYLLPPTLREFLESFPEFTVRIEIVTARTAAEAIRSQRVDLALIPQPVQRSPRTEFFPFAQESLGFLLNPLHPWALRQKVQRAEIARQRFILPERDSGSYALIESYFRREKIRIHPFIEVGNEEASKQFVRLDIGIGIFPTWVAAAEVQEGVLVTLPIGRRRLTRTWGVMAPTGRKLTFAENVFVGISRNVVANTISGPQDSGKEV